MSKAQHLRDGGSLDIEAAADAGAPQRVIERAVIRGWAFWLIGARKIRVHV